MKFLKTFFIFMLVLCVTSCYRHAPRYQKELDEVSKEEILEKYEEIIIFVHFLHKKNKEYREALSFVQGQKEIYEQIVQIFYDINVLHSEIISNHEMSFQALEKIEEQISLLQKLISSVDWPEEMREKADEALKIIQEIKALIDQAQVEPVDEEPSAEGEADPSAEGEADPSAEGEADPSAEKPADEAQAEKPVDEAQAEKPADEAQAEKPVDEAQAEKPIDEAQADKPADEVQTEKPVDEVQTEKPVDEAQAEKPVDEAQAEKPVDEAQAEKPVDEAQAEKPADEAQADLAAQKLKVGEATIQVERRADGTVDINVDNPLGGAEGEARATVTVPGDPGHQVNINVKNVKQAGN